MHSALAFLAVLGAAVAAPGRRSAPANTTIASTTPSTQASIWSHSSSSSTPSLVPSGHVGSSILTTKSVWSSVPSGHVGSSTKPVSSPSGSKPISSSKSVPSGGSIRPTGSWSRSQGPSGTGSVKPPVTTSTRTVTGVITSTITSTVTKTGSTLVPHSTSTSANGQVWPTTYLSTSYYTTTYKTTETVVISPVPSQSGQPVGGSCPAPSTVTITQAVSQPTSVAVGPGEHVTSELVTITVGSGYTTSVWVSYPAGSTTSIHAPVSTSTHGSGSNTSKPVSSIPSSIKSTQRSSLPPYPTPSGSPSGSVRPSGSAPVSTKSTPSGSPQRSSGYSSSSSVKPSKAW